MQRPFRFALFYIDMKKDRVDYDAERSSEIYSGMIVI